MRVLGLHGFGGSGADFEVLAERLPTDWIWETPALPLADAPPLVELIMGYSMGARSALSLVLAGAPCSALVLIGGTPGIADSAARRKRLVDDQALADRIDGIGVPAFMDAWAEHPMIRSQANSPQPWRDQRAARRRTQSASALRAQLRLLGQGATVPMWDQLAAIQTPTVWVVGADDSKYATIAQSAAAQMPDATVVAIRGAGHAPHFEQPDATATALQAWLAKSG